MSWKKLIIQSKDRQQRIYFSLWQKIAGIFILFSLGMAKPIAQTTLQFQNFTQKDGLSSNYILSILQDHQGFMWIGTENGLNRFDGQHFLAFRFDPEDPKTLNGNWIRTMLEDSRHQLWIGTKRGLNHLNRETGKVERIPLIKDGQAMKTSSVINIYESPFGSLWVTTLKNGVFKLEQDQKEEKWQATHFSYDKPAVQNKASRRTFNVAHATAEDLWIIHSDGIDQVHIPTKKNVSYRLPDMGLDYEEKSEIFSGIFDGQGKFFLGFNNALFFLDITKDKPAIQAIQAFSPDSTPAVNIIRNMTFDRSNVLLFPTNNDLALFDTKSKKLEFIRKEGQVGQHTFPYGIHTIYKDRKGNYWMGTPGNGLYLGRRRRNLFAFYQHDPTNPYSISKGAVRSFLEEEGGGLWIGVLDHGLDKLVLDGNNRLKKHKSVTGVPGQPKAWGSAQVIKLIQGNKGNIWLATNSNGLIKIDSTGKLLETFTHRPDDPNSLSGNRIWGLAKDSDGYIWAGTWLKGLNRLDPKTGQIIRYQHDPTDPYSLGNDHIRYLYFDQQGILWIGTGGGLGHYDPKTNRFTHFQHNPGDPNSLSDNQVWAIYERQQGDLWVGTDTGLNRYDPSTQQFEYFYEKDGLPDNSIYGILEDDEGLLWISTKNGLARQQASSSSISFRSLGLEDGLPTTSFIPKAYLNSAQSDQLFFGSTEGVLVIRPTLLQQDTSQAQMVVHEMKRFKRKAIPGAVVTEFFVSDRKQTVNLGYQDQSITFTLSDLNWMNHPIYKYEYQLAGFNKQWMPLEENMQVSFSNLPPGKYTLRSRAKTLENIGLEAYELVRLRVFPPWWKSWWAYLGYIFIAAATIFLLIRSYFWRQLEKKEAENLRTLDAFKNKLFTNIAHEFRTPLTIISGMAEQIKKKPDRWQEEGYDLIQKNTHNLLDLINQILELQKLESGQLKVKMQQGNIIPFLQNIFVQFRAYGQSKRQSIDFIPQVDELNMDYDPEKILRIVSNLLTNAIKYAPEQGKIVFQISSGVKAGIPADQCLILMVKDNGPGIPEDQLPYIFDRFFQASTDSQTSKTGTGVGLSLTHELVKLLGGKIEIDSQYGAGATFRVYLPIMQKATRKEAASPVNVRAAVFGKDGQFKKVADPSNDELPLALIVEDNPDIAQYLQICLEGDYRLEVAANGQLGIARALETIPDIIISDVMMPEKDGFEVCETLKEDIRTSHIPIILLTAKSDIESRITGLKQGADDYLGKPFHEEELLVRMRNLLNIRRQLQERYQHIYTHPLPKLEEEKASKEDEFILKLKEIVEARMDDPDFNLNELSKGLFLSRSQLGRKVKALTGRSLAIYIRSIRLQKAKQLLLTTNLSIKEICYEVGFSNAVYFSQSYSKEFSESPSKTRDLK